MAALLAGVGAANADAGGAGGGRARSCKAKPNSTIWTPMDKDRSGGEAGGGGAEPPRHEGGAGLLELAEAERRAIPRTRLGARLRNYFLTGLVIVGPVSITLYIVWWFIGLIDSWVKPWLPDRYLPDAFLPFSVPGIGLVIAVIALIAVGALTANLFGRTLINWGERILGRMPVVRSVYRGLKQIFETVLSQSSASFKQVGLIEYPRRGIYCLVFVSTETRGEIRDKMDDGNGLLSVFLPTTPNPTSGFLLFVPRKDVRILDMTVEDAAKLVISAGLVVPEHPAAPPVAATKGRRRPARSTTPPQAAEPVQGT